MGIIDEVGSGVTTLKKVREYTIVNSFKTNLC